MGGSNIEVGVIHNINHGRKLGSPSWNSISIIEVKSFSVEYKVRHKRLVIGLFGFIKIIMVQE